MGIMTFRRALCLAIVVLGTSVFVTTKLAAPEGAEHDSPAVAAPHDIPRRRDCPRVCQTGRYPAFTCLYESPWRQCGTWISPSMGAVIWTWMQPVPSLGTLRNSGLPTMSKYSKRIAGWRVPEIRQVRVSLPSRSLLPFLRNRRSALHRPRIGSEP